MPLQLIPFPISILFALVFAAAWIAVTYKLRKGGRIYSFLFKASVIAILVFSSHSCIQFQPVNVFSKSSATKYEPEAQGSRKRETKMTAAKVAQGFTAFFKPS